MFLPCLLVCWFASNFNIGHNCCDIDICHLIFEFDVHVYLMELHILSGERSRSLFKVKCQLHGRHIVLQTHHVVFYSECSLSMEIFLQKETLHYHEYSYICTCINIDNGHDWDPERQKIKTQNHFSAFVVCL